MDELYDKKRKIMWKKLDPKTTFSSLIERTRSGRPPRNPIGLILDYYIENFKFEKPQQKHDHVCTINKIKRAIDTTIPADKLAIKDIKDVNPKTYPMIMHALRFYENPDTPKIQPSKSNLPKNTVEKKQEESVSESVNLKIKSAPLDLLDDLLLGSFGKHIDLRTVVLDSIATCPPNEFRIIVATKEIAHDKKERVSIMHAINKVIRPKGWTIRWAAHRRVFYVIGKETLEKYKSERIAK